MIAAITSVRTISQKYLLLSLLLIVPLFLTGPQIITGSIVNFLLLSISNKTNKNSWLLISAIPSLMATVFTPYLFYLWPIITIANYSFITIAKKNIILAITVKSIILFLCASILFKLNLIPSIILISMGTIQIITASIGSIGFLTYERITKAK